MRIKVCLTFLGLSIAMFAQGQKMDRPSAHEISISPAWIQMMYGPSPKAWAVDSAFNAYYRTHPFEKSYHTQYYKRWRRAAAPYVQDDGSIAWPDIASREAADAAYLRKREAAQSTGRGSGWQVLGPMRMYTSASTAETDQTNVYSMAQCASNTNVMYAGTEPGEVYKSTDGGITWNSVSQNSLIDRGVTAVAVDPANPDNVLAGAGWNLSRSTDGGSTWATVLSANNLEPNEIVFHPTQSNIVLLAGDAGLYRSVDGGANFTQVSNARTWDIKHKPGHPNTVYCVQENSTLIRAEFFVSTDAGMTWTLQDNGWYSSSDPARSAMGARIAVTPADSNRVYAYLIGESKANDYGFIGLYKSTDGGTTWSLPNGPDGGPYTTAHPNLARGTNTWNYHQGFYNCALMASNTNADQVLIGGLNLWRSDDGGSTFSSVSGYIGGPLNMHVDNQDFRVFGNEYWISTDGGIYKSTDFYNSPPTVSMDGIHGSDYWGFGSGWNEDVLVGGLYHNGNNAWHENYGAGNHLSLGGGEAATGYVNPGLNRNTFYSDLGGRVLPDNIGMMVGQLPFGLSPNETYFSAESSELEWHPNCYNICYLGNDHRFWRSEDGGGSFSLVDSFGTNPDSKLRYIEISRSNPQVILVSQQPASGNAGTVWRTVDGGDTWASVPLPNASNKRKILIAMDPEDHEKFFLAFPQAGNGTKVYKTTNGGSSWANLSTAMLDGEAIHSMVLIGGTNEGLYLCTARSVYYRENGMPDWLSYAQDLPLQFNTNIARPFYRDGKLRIASYGKGIWSNTLHTQPSRPIAGITVDKLTSVCDADSFRFEDYSMLNHSGASWAWTFQGGNPASSNLRNPVVQFVGNGQHMVTLSVTDANAQTSHDTIHIELSGIANTSITADFEAQFPPAGWRTEATGGLVWRQDNAVGGFGNSNSSAACDNFYNDGQGTWVDMRAYVNLDSIQTAELTFDVAYAEYGGQYTDTLEIQISTDCGQNFTQVYRNGGGGLATAPNLTSGPFVPQASEWRTDTVDLSAYLGQEQVVVAFRCIGHYGQVMYLDNINLSGNPLVGLTSHIAAPFIQLTPNPIESGNQVKFRTDASGLTEVVLYDLQGKRVRSLSMVNGESLSTEGLTAGSYVWEARNHTMIQRGKLTVFKAQR